MIVERKNCYGIVMTQRDGLHVTWEDGEESQYPTMSELKKVAPTLKIKLSEGIEYREEVPPEGWVVVDKFIPHTTPWDYHGRCWACDQRNTLWIAGVPALICNIMEKHLHPFGSGPGGRVRFGDDMLPGMYRIAVPKRFELTAVSLLQLARSSQC